MADQALVQAARASWDGGAGPRQKVPRNERRANDAQQPLLAVIRLERGQQQEGVPQLEERVDSAVHRDNACGAEDDPAQL